MYMREVLAGIAIAVLFAIVLVLQQAGFFGDSNGED